MAELSSQASFTGRVAVITGGGGELGRALARGFVDNGARVALLDIEPVWRRARALARRLGEQGLAVRCDVTREADVRRAFSVIRSRWGGVHFLINNAGIEGPTARLEKIGRRGWERTLAVNLTGAFLCAREAARSMKGPPGRAGGCIIQIGSVAGRIAYPFRLAYAASKCALEGFTRTLAAELGHYSIRANLVAPGPIAGQRMERVIRHRARALGRSRTAVRQSYLKATTLGRLVGPDDVVRAVLFLCSGAGENITGQILEVSAGWTAGSL